MTLQLVYLLASYKLQTNQSVKPSFPIIVYRKISCSAYQAF